MQIVFTEELSNGKEAKMAALSESGIFFDEKVVHLDTWRLKRLAKATRTLVAGSLDLSAFITAQDDNSNRFLVSIASAPKEPLLIYEVTVVDEYTEPRFECVFCKK